MPGHKLWQTFNGRFDTYVTLRREFAFYKPYNLSALAHTLDDVSAEDFDSVAQQYGEQYLTISCR